MDSGPLCHIRKVLVANRGEIAVRCIRACRELGVQSVAITTEPDASSLHAQLADEVFRLPGSKSTAYTDGDAILDICKRCGADAIIPGYGFLSENVEFAEAAAKAGITFVGPSSASIQAMGLKHEAREIANAANVPIIPGTSLLCSREDAIEGARQLGFPVMMKATGGGGGMGLQICQDEEDVGKAFALVESRAGALFKNTGVFLEKYFPHSRHIEVQVAGNGNGIVTFGERECSLQRRHQKVIEECPSSFFERRPGLRERMLQASVRYASQLKYKSVGTVEFLVDDQTGEFFFLEMNTRLQVEHGISELCYGVDLVHLMLRQADYEHGGQLGIPSELLKRLGRPQPLGWAIEVRVYAEVPLRDFAPSPGVLQFVRWPEGDGVRVDTWVQSGQHISALYDPLIGKVMVHSLDGRLAAQQKMLAALANTSIQGTQTNLQYLSKVLQSDEFTTGFTLTNFLSTFQFHTPAVQVLGPGLFTTVQDYPGRPSIGHGVPPSGPMDDLSSRAANILVGNNVGVEPLEVTLTGPELLFHVSAAVAICGAQIPVTIDGINQPMWSRIVVQQGQTLKLGTISGKGSRAYIAFRGGFPQVPAYLGSKSTSPELQLGGLQGRRLQANDILDLSSEPVVCESDYTALSLPYEALPDYNISEIYCLQGPFGSEDILSQEGQNTIYNSRWTISHNSSRSGVRLEGSRLSWARTSGGGGGSHPSNVFDYGYPNGGVNWTGEYPIILARDRPDLGGFACPMTICSGEMWKVGQLKAGDAVQFRPTTFENAMQISRAKDAWLDTLSRRVNGDNVSIRSPRVLLGPETTSSILRAKPVCNSHPPVTFRQGGDTSIIVEFGNQIADLRNTTCVKLLSEQVVKRSLAGVRCEPNIATLTVHYDPYQLSQIELLGILESIENSIGELSHAQVPVREVHLPLCLDHPSIQEATDRYMESIRPTAAYLPDNVEYLRKANALNSRKDVFDSLLKTPWLAVAVGFFVGTPIMFPLDPRYLYTGQKYNPNRVYTPSGSVGLGGSLLGLYPVASPGGYQLMGRTLSAWDTAGVRPGFTSSRPWLFDYFDIVRFYEVTEDEFDNAHSDFLAGRYTFKITNATLDMDTYIARFDATSRDPEYLEWRKRQALAAAEMGRLEQSLFDEWRAAKAITGGSQSRDSIDGPNSVRIESPVDANVWKVQVQVGDVLESGQVVAILEAMKMEIKVSVPDSQQGARVTSILCNPGDVAFMCRQRHVDSILAMKGRPKLRVAPCSFCNKQFKRQEHLQRHLRTLAPAPEKETYVPFSPSPSDVYPPCNQPSPLLDSARAPPVAIGGFNPNTLGELSRNDGDRRSSAIVGSEASSVATQTVKHSFSQAQLMGKFSINEPLVDQCEPNIDHASYDAGPEKRTPNVGSDDTPNFMAFEAFNADIFYAEPGMISHYLHDAFPPVQSPLQFMDMPIEYDAMDSIQTHSPSNIVDRAAGYAEATMQMTLSPTIVNLTESQYRQAPPKDRHIEFQPASHEACKTTHPDAPKDGEQRSSQLPDTRLDVSDSVTELTPWTVSVETYKALSNEVYRHRDSLPRNLALPSRQMLSRYLASYFRGFHPHLPFLHMPTVSANSISGMLLLAIAAVGAFYAFEHPNGYTLYFVSKAIITQQLEQKRRDSTFHLMHSLPPYAELSVGSSKSSETSSRSAPSPQNRLDCTVELELIQALLVLILTTSWLDGPLLSESLAMSSQLAVLVRESLASNPSGDIECWTSWCLDEGKRRTVFAAYVVLNIQTICFNMPPHMTVGEIKLPLPCSDAEWRASTSAEWHRVRRQGNLRELDLHECMKHLLSGRPLDPEIAITAFGNYVLIQGILQQILFERHASSSFLESTSSLPVEKIRTFDKALTAWQAGWNSATEPMIDPASPHGPLAFNSTAVLRLAHIHLGVILGDQTSLWCRDPGVLAQAFEQHRNPVVPGSAHIEEAVLHAVYALRVPVRMGVAFVARTQTGHWSVQHAVSNFTCAFLLTHWLESLYHLVATSGMAAMRPEERRLLQMTEVLVEETHLESSLGPRGDYPRRIRRLASSAVKLWAETCKGVQVFEIVHVIGSTLSLVAENLDRRGSN
ncbi:hypothetical protein P170DRAFT_493398 [Aspergillus steynii IBT 23096]|uniref:Urea carboxylase n=1 Tax=Aspergillus steynii IBT 23096 TaxID=1392250 RepID=A0A2I2GE53_9EURO|nr:uncharacterized protein P170DRAFT_493398 [Aspergillus steynii IBT 23096]PLB51174.1 hypothetical protein P170DRAFT_493398 [Aspergillus steynii IBT 23096]